MAEPLATAVTPYRTPCRYPWTEWFDGRPWRLLPGEDFTCSLAGIKSTIHAAARARKLDVITRMTGDGGIEFQVIGTFI